jgi:tetratricopeptide (TPR) repeat protein
MIVAVVWSASLVNAQQAPTPQQLFTQERWPELVQVLGNVHDRSAEQEFQYGIALSHVERWDQAREAFLHGSRLQPRDKRFPIELAGVAFKQKQRRRAIAYLQRGLHLDPRDDYANEFIASIYFLQANLEAAVKYWNRVSAPKPQIVELRNEPPLRIRPTLLDHAFVFSPAAVLTLKQLRATEVRLQNLETFSISRLELAALPDGRFDSVFRAQELNGLGSSKVEVVLHTFRGIAFQEVTPEYYNLKGSAINVTSLGRWDSDKRRYALGLSGPLRQNPQWRYRVSADLRNENWDVRSGPAPVLASLNLRRQQAVAEVSRLMGWRWRWSLGAEFSHRDYRNVTSGGVLTPELLAAGFQLKQTATISYQVVRSPEHRFEFSSGANSQAARLWSQSPQSFEKLQAQLEAHWLPQSSGDDFETLWRARAGKTLGRIPFDELFMLGLERDNDRDLWMRAHVGTRDGRKGSAPLGRDYLLSSWETDKNLYSNGFLSVKLGPFVDTGKVTDPDSASGSHKWMWDTGAQAKLRVLGVGAALIYGKDLRTGNNAVYVTLAR